MDKIGYGRLYKGNLRCWPILICLQEAVSNGERGPVRNTATVWQIYRRITMCRRRICLSCAGAYVFLRRYAAVAWEFEHDGCRWEIDLPPEVDGLPEPKRFRTHAQQEARRVADVQLYDVCAEVTGRAGQARRRSWRESTTAAISAAP
jgi:hypothetical protein